MTTLLDKLSRHGYLLAVAAVTLSTLVFLPGRDFFAKGQWAILYLLVVVLVAGISGTGPAVLAAALAFFAWNFFLLPPYHTLRIHDSKDWLSLLAFLAAGVVMGLQTGRLREREARALAREREVVAINRLSASLVSGVSTETVSEALLAAILRLLGAGRAALFLPDEDGALRTAHTAPAESQRLDPAVLAAAERCFASRSARGLSGPTDTGDTPRAAPGQTRSETPGRKTPPAEVYVPLLTASGAHGVLYVSTPATTAERPPASDRLLVALANLTAAFLERQRLQAELTTAAAEREADVLKSSLLSSVSHELKTPLAALTATVSNLLESDTKWDEDTARAELQAIVTDVARLNNGVGSLLDLSRLEARSWHPRRDWYDLDDIIDTALEGLPAGSRRRVRQQVPRDLGVFVDYEQWVRVVRNILENALLYSPSGSPVTMAAADLEDRVELWIEDAGPGVPPEDRERIFEKFFRGRQASGAVPSGTGLGLAIAREIVSAHDGTIGVRKASTGGACVEVVLPTARPSRSSTGAP
jgi:two-component system sensor histidine kinase KdpD